jgi:rod shape-determining protein MreC
MKKNFSRTLQTVVIILVAVGLVVLALGGYFSSATDWFNRMLVDVQGWISARYLAIVDFVTVPRDVATLRQRNADLEAEVARLQTQVISLQEQVTETEILSALVDFARANPESSYKGASVIGRDPSPFLRYIIINVGSNQGIRAGMPVVTDKGLVGRVDAVAAEAARVQLITDPDSAVNITLQGTTTEASMAGSITGDLDLEMVPQNAALEIGAIVMTSGLGGDFPPNILVGQVITVRKLEAELFQEATVQPNVDFSTIQYVLVITNFSQMDTETLIPEETP